MTTAARYRTTSLAAALLAAASAVGAQEPTAPAPPAAARCYRFDRPYFLVMWRDAARAVHYDSTATIALLEADAPAPTATPDTRYRPVRAVGPRPGVEDTRHRPPFTFWQRLAGDTVFVRWHDGFSGPEFTLRPRGDSLVGEVRRTSDSITRDNPDGRFPPTPAAAVRVGCGER